MIKNRGKGKNAYPMISQVEIDEIFVDEDFDAVKGRELCCCGQEDELELEEALVLGRVA